MRTLAFTDLSEYRNGTAGCTKREEFLGQLKNIEPWRMPLWVKLLVLLIFKMQHVDILGGRGGGGNFCLSSVQCFLCFPCSKRFEKGVLWRLFHLQTPLCSRFKHFFSIPTKRTYLPLMSIWLE